MATKVMHTSTHEGERKKVKKKKKKKVPDCHGRPRGDPSAPRMATK
jgi:hypothetical protein